LKEKGQVGRRSFNVVVVGIIVVDIGVVVGNGVDLFLITDARSGLCPIKKAIVFDNSTLQRTFKDAEQQGKGQKLDPIRPLDAPLSLLI